MTNSLLRAGWLLLAGIATCSPGQAQDAKAGREKAAQQCVVCHGVDGIAVAPNAPNLAGENATYIVAQLRAFRSGKRSHEQMTIIAADLEDADIADLARWYSLIKVVATPPDLD
jgi:cytochrome c553